MISAVARVLPARVAVPNAPRPAGPLDLGAPLTEWVLGRLPGPRWLLSSFWAGAVLVTPFVLLAARRLTEPNAAIDGLKELGPQAVLACVVALLLYGIARLVRNAKALGPDVDLMTIDEPATIERTTRWNVAGPIALSGVGIVVASSRSWSANGLLPTLIVLPFLALAVVPVMTFVWTYIR